MLYVCNEIKQEKSAKTRHVNLKLYKSYFYCLIKIKTEFYKNKINQIRCNLIQFV